MKKLTTEELSILSKNKRYILSFVYNELDITVLPPLRETLRGGNNLFDYKYSVFVNSINQSKLINPEYKELHSKWFDIKENEEHEEFKRAFLELLYAPKNAKTLQGLQLRKHIIRMSPFADYLSEYNAMFNGTVGTTSYSIYEQNEIRAINQIILNNKTISLKPEDIKIRININKKPKRKLDLIL